MAESSNNKVGMTGIPVGLPFVISASQSNWINTWLKSPDEFLKACTDAKPSIEFYRSALRNGDKDKADELKKSSIAAVVPMSRFNIFERRNEENANPVVVKDLNGDDANVIYIDIDHIGSQELFEKAINRVCQLDEEVLDVLLLHASISSGVNDFGLHLIVSTFGLTSEDIPGCQHEVFDKIAIDGLEDFHDKKVRNFSSLSFIPRPEDVYIISKRLFV